MNGAKKELIEQIVSLELLRFLVGEQTVTEMTESINIKMQEVDER